MPDYAPTEIERIKQVFAKHRAYYSDPEHGFYRFLSDCVYTTDEEAAPELGESVIKKFPVDLPYIQYMIRHTITPERMVVIPKSRRMKVTWLFAAYCVWYAIAFERRNILWQAQSGKKSSDTLKRKMLFILEHIPRDLFLPFIDMNRKAIPQGLTKELVNYYKPKYGQNGLESIALTRLVRDPDTGEEVLEEDSVIHGVAEGADQWRQFTVSLGVCDEFAFFDHPAESVKGARPTIGERGKLFLISSANPGYMAEMVKRPELQPGEAQPPAPKPYFKGIDTWYSKTGFLVCRVHYTADIKKRGKAWEEWFDGSDPEKGSARRGYDQKQWNQEFEIDFSVHDGTPFYPAFTAAQHTAPLTPLHGVPLVLGFDFGLDPSTVVCQIHPAGFILVLAELVSHGEGIVQHLENLKPLLDERFSWWRGKKKKRAAFMEDVGLMEKDEVEARLDMVISFIDPAGTQRSQIDKTTVESILKAQGFNPQTSIQEPALRKEATDYTLTNFRKVPGRNEMRPMLIIDTSCEELIEAMRGGCKRAKTGKFHKEKNYYSHIVESLEYVNVKVADPVQQRLRVQKRAGYTSRPHVQRNSTV